MCLKGNLAQRIIFFLRLVHQSWHQGRNRKERSMQANETGPYLKRSPCLRRVKINRNPDSAQTLCKAGRAWCRQSGKRHVPSTEDACQMDFKSTLGFLVGNIKWFGVLSLGKNSLLFFHLTFRNSRPILSKMCLGSHYQKKAVINLIKI